MLHGLVALSGRRVYIYIYIYIYEDNISYDRLGMCLCLWRTRIGWMGMVCVITCFAVSVEVENPSVIVLYTLVWYSVSITRHTQL
jgi:hypothetical protein